MPSSLNAWFRRQSVAPKLTPPRAESQPGPTSMPPSTEPSARRSRPGLRSRHRPPRAFARTSGERTARVLVGLFEAARVLERIGAESRMDAAAAGGRRLSAEAVNVLDGRRRFEAKVAKEPACAP